MHYWMLCSSNGTNSKKHTGPFPFRRGRTIHVFFQFDSMGNVPAGKWSDVNVHVLLNDYKRNKLCRWFASDDRMLPVAILCRTMYQGYGTSKNGMVMNQLMVSRLYQLNLAMTLSFVCWMDVANRKSKTSSGLVSYTTAEFVYQLLTCVVCSKMDHSSVLQIGKTENRNLM